MKKRSEKYMAQVMKKRLHKQYERKNLQSGDIVFNQRSKISCVGVSMTSLLFEYLCWILAGRPDNHKVKGKKK